MLAIIVPPGARAYSQMLQAPFVRICARLRGFGRRILYHSILVDSHRATEWVERFSTCHWLGPLVKSLYVRSSPSLARSEDAQARACLSDIINRCNQLRTLCFSLWGRDAGFQTRIALSNHLRTFRISATDAMASSTRDALLSAVIDQKIRLRTLHLDSGAAIAPTTLPDIGYFTCDELIVRNDLQHHPRPREKLRQSRQSHPVMPWLISVMDPKPTRLSMPECLFDALTYGALLEGCADRLRQLDLDLVGGVLAAGDLEASPELEDEDENEISAEAFPTASLAKCTSLTHFSLVGKSLSSVILEALPPTLASLRLTWHVSAWPFWEPLSAWMEKLEAPPRLEIDVERDWEHDSEEDDEDDTLESFCRDYRAVIVIDDILARQKDAAGQGDGGHAAPRKRISEMWAREALRTLPPPMQKTLLEVMLQLAEEMGGTVP